MMMLIIVRLYLLLVGAIGVLILFSNKKDGAYQPLIIRLLGVQIVLGISLVIAYLLQWVL